NCPLIHLGKRGNWWERPWKWRALFQKADESDIKSRVTGTQNEELEDLEPSAPPFPPDEAPDEEEELICDIPNDEPLARVQQEILSGAQPSDWNEYANNPYSAMSDETPINGQNEGLREELETLESISLVQAIPAHLMNIKVNNEDPGDQALIDEESCSHSQVIEKAVAGAIIWECMAFVDTLSFVLGRDLAFQV
ncbi:unnamed protein product, partial [Darwinula stevensoni]